MLYFLNCCFQAALCQTQPWKATRNAGELEVIYIASIKLCDISGFSCHDNLLSIIMWYGKKSNHQSQLLWTRPQTGAGV